MRTTKTSLLLFATATLILSLSGCSKKPEAPTATQQTAQTQSAEARPPRNPLKNAYFGDLHLHTGYSMDAFAFGTRTTPEDSYKYAHGRDRGIHGQAAEAHRAARLSRCHRSRRVSREWFATPPIRTARSQSLRLVRDDDQHRSQGVGRGVQEAHRFTWSSTSLFRSSTIQRCCARRGRSTRPFLTSTTSPASSRPLSDSSGPRRRSSRTCIAA